MREGKTCLGRKTREWLRQVCERKAGLYVSVCEDVTMLGCMLTKNRANTEVITEIQ